MFPPVELLESVDPVQEGRECRVCGEDRRAQMVADLAKPYGHKTLCLEHSRIATAARREDPAVRAREAERTTSARLRSIGRPRWDSFGEGHRCVYCHGPFEDVDHIVPRSSGGLDIPENLVPACIACNRGPGGKFAKPLPVWAAGRTMPGSPILAAAFEYAAEQNSH